MFKAKQIYIKISRDKIEITDLDTNETVYKQAIEPFSSTRNIVSNFNNANETIKAALKDLRIRTGFLSPLQKVLVQQLEGLEEGLSDVEKRGLRDLAEMAGARKVFLLEKEQPLSADAAREYLKNSQ
jgi:hypothetical protein